MNFFPKDEILCLTYTDENTHKPLYYITSNFFRNEYYLYKADSKENAKKTKYKAETPIELYKYIK